MKVFTKAFTYFSFPRSRTKVSRRKPSSLLFPSCSFRVASWAKQPCITHRIAIHVLLVSLLLNGFIVRGQNAPLLTPKEHQRGTEQTFLTYPEWYLVSSPAEYATLLKTQPPSEFPFLGHTRQLWQSYGEVIKATQGKYPLNAGYHVMIVVISASTTVEYAVRSAYETLIGRLTALTQTHGMTEEDKFAAQAAQDYVDFIRQQPFYRFDFYDKLIRLWKETSFWGPDMLRKWERKYALTTEYAVKAGYAWFIKKMTEASYDPTIDLTVAALDRLPAGIEGELPEMKIMQQFPDGSALVSLPRYDAFKTYSVALAKRGSQFQEIAGNRSVILICALVPRSWMPDAQTYDLLFRQPVLTQPALDRVVLVVPVASLSKTLVQLTDSGYTVEHVYDY